MYNWTRKDLKAKAKISFKQNYWKCVLAALILTLISGGIGAGTGSSVGNTYVTKYFNQLDRNSYLDHNDNSYNFSDDYDYDFDDDIDADLGFDDEFDLDSFGNSTGDIDGAVATGAIILICVLVLIIGVISLLVSAFLINPLVVGLRRFFYKNGRENVGLDHLGFAFKNNYLNIVKIMFFRDIKLIGWTLLLIIPGIIKAYEYRMLPYILQENPNMTSKEAFSLSKTMMSGNKWKAFVLDLSFILWYLLVGVTLGIVGIFYVNPYVYQTDANLYAALKGDYEGTDYDVNRTERGTEDETVYVEFTN